LIDVGERLRLYALGGVDHQQRALAGGERAVDLVGEIDVPWSVDQVEDVVLAVARAVIEPHGLRLDGDAAFALDVHGIEDLLHHLALGETAGRLDQPVGQRRLAVVDMRDDGEVADIFDGRVHGARISTRVLKRQAGGLDDSWRLASPRNRGTSFIPPPPPAAPPGMARVKPARRRAPRSRGRAAPASNARGWHRAARTPPPRCRRTPGNRASWRCRWRRSGRRRDRARW